MKWFKIGDDNFTAKEICIQYTIDTANNTYGYAKIVSSGTQMIDLTVTVENNKKNNDYFFNLFDKSRQWRQGYVSDYKFDISSNEFTSYGCIIKSIMTDPTTNLITMDIRSDYSNVKPIDERRDEIINEILDETSKNKNI